MTNKMEYYMNRYIFATNVDDKLHYGALVKSLKKKKGRK